MALRFSAWSPCIVSALVPELYPRAWRPVSLVFVQASYAPLQNPSHTMFVDEHPINTWAA